MFCQESQAPLSGEVELIPVTAAPAKSFWAVGAGCPKGPSYVCILYIYMYIPIYIYTCVYLYHMQNSGFRASTGPASEYLRMLAEVSLAKVSGVFNFVKSDTSIGFGALHDYPKP